jgi:hypothetical protein
MVNPLLTILFDIFLVGSAVAVSAAMATEYFIAREPHVGRTRPQRPVATRTVRRRATVHRMPAPRRRAA